MNATPAGEVWLVRHGATDWASVGRHTGRRDLSLNADGEAQAEALRARLGQVRFDEVRCSPLQRARATCRIAGFDDPTLDADMMEWDYGDCEGRTAGEIRTEIPGWTIWRNGVTNGETVDDVGARADRVLARIRSQVDSGERVALFAHGHFLRILTARWIEQSPRLGERLALDPAHISVLGFKHGTPIIRSWNT